MDPASFMLGQILKTSYLNQIRPNNKDLFLGEKNGTGINC